MALWERIPIVPRTDFYSGSAVLTPEQFGDVPCMLVRFRASIDNAGKVYIGVREDAYPDHVYEIPAGDDTGWFMCPNTNVYYYVTENAGDVVFAWSLN